MLTSDIKTNIIDCKIVPVQANRDGRGCLYEVFRESWDGAFPTVQWNVCSSISGVVRGVHVHADYHEFYTLPRGIVELGLVDIRRDSSTFGNSFQAEWSDKDDVAVVVPKGVAHVVNFLEDSVLAFGLSGYWRKEYDIIGCQWNDPELGFKWKNDESLQSCRDSQSGSFKQMIIDYERISTLLEPISAING